MRSEPPSREGDRNRARLHLSNVGGSAGDPRRINRSHIEKAKETLIDQPALPGGRVGGLHRTQFGRADTGKTPGKPFVFFSAFLPTFFPVAALVEENCGRRLLCRGERDSDVARSLGRDLCGGPPLARPHSRETPGQRQRDGAACTDIDSAGDSLRAF